MPCSHNSNKSFSPDQDSRQQLDHLSVDNGDHFLALSAREGDLQCAQLLGDPAVLHQGAENTNGKVTLALFDVSSLFHNLSYYLIYKQQFFNAIISSCLSIPG